jgi:Encapsulating protein for peroxidase
LFRRYPGTDLMQIEHLKRLCTRGIVKADIDGGVLVSREVGSLVVGQDMQISYLGPDAAHENFTVSESAVLKVEAPRCDLHTEARVKLEQTFGQTASPTRYGKPPVKKGCAVKNRSANAWGMVVFS